MKSTLARTGLELIATLFGAVLVLWMLLSLTGYDSAAALGALWRGALGSWNAFASGTLVRATPLLFCGLAVAVAFRAGILNIGAEGQFLLGAVAATSAATLLPVGSGVGGAVLALASGVTAGALWAAIAAVLRLRFGVLEVISTIMLNFVALHLTGLLVRGPLQEPTGVFPQSAMVEEAFRLPRVVSGTRVHAGVLLAIGCALGLGWFLRSTAAGFRLRMTGANPNAARVAGMIDVDRVSLITFLLSGALAGLGGAVEVLGVTFALYENLSPGYGYSAIAVALLARLNPVYAIGSAIFFGALQAGAAAMQREAQVPSVMVTVVEACVILMLLASEWIARRRGGSENFLWGGPPSSRSTPASNAPVTAKP
jgi:general nucleoside transport system permease protein